VPGTGQDIPPQYGQYASIVPCARLARNPWGRLVANSSRIEGAPSGARHRARPELVSFNGDMFTGLIREVGTVRSMEGGRLVLSAPETAAGAEIGDSIAVDGACLTVVERNERELQFDTVPETLVRTSLGALAAGSSVNLEPALRAGDALGGHYVQGHVDGVGAFRGVGDGLHWFDAPPEILRYVVEKGSIAVQGTSLTVAAVDDRGFAVALIPHTLEATTLGALAAGDPVNLETDVLAKYVEKLLPR
jgi:riboflavin synthase